MNSNNQASAFVLARGEAIASRMFRSAGVAIEWHSAAPAVCQGQETKTVIVDFAADAPPTEHPGAMAYAQPYDTAHIVVLYNRIDRSTDGPTQASTLLASVLTHEITHVLQGISRHSETGLMKAQWNAHDIAQMAYRPLPFTADDIDLIRQGLQRSLAMVMARNGLR